jgi:hypothetical protein
MCWLWLAFISLGGYSKVSFVNGSGVVSHAFTSCAGQRYETGGKVADGFKKSMRIVFDQHLGQWNYVAIP